MPLYPNELKDGSLTSGAHNGDYNLERPRGSCYLKMKYLFDHYLNLYGDWNWLVNFRTREILKASEFEALSKRYILFIFYKLLSILIWMNVFWSWIICHRFSIIFQENGFTKGDSLIAYIGNHNLLYPMFGGAWLLGGRVSSGDETLETKSIISQVLYV